MCLVLHQAIQILQLIGTCVVGHPLWCFASIGLVSEIGNIERTVTSNFFSNVLSGDSGKKAQDKV